MSNLLKKVVAGFSTAALVASMVIIPATSANAASAGEVYKSADGTVWFITSDMQKRPFTSGGTFLSYGFLSFSQVKGADASVTALPTGSFIAPQDGRIFCATETKGSDVAGECSLITGGMKAAFTSANVFSGLGFSSSRAYYGDSSFLTKTTNIASTGEAHRPGVLVNNSGTVQLVVNGGLWGVPSLEVFNSWGWSFADVVPANGADKNLNQIGIIPGRQAGQLVPTATATPNTPGTVSASVGSNNPAASTVVAGSAGTMLADFTLTGNGTVNAITLKRLGVSSETTLTRVYLYDGSMRLTDSASVSTDGTIQFTGLNMAINGSKTLTVRADISNASGVAGQTVGIQLMNVTLASGTVSGTPVNGNIHTIAAVSDLGTVTFTTPTGSGDTTASNDVNVFQTTLNVGNRPVLFNRLALREIGSVSYNDIRNFRLLVDGETVNTVANLDANGYVTFSFNKTLSTGSHTVRVVADIIGGSGRSFYFSLRNAADISLVDTQYNAGITLTGSAIPSTMTPANIAGGNLTIEKATNSPSGNTTLEGTNVVLGTFKLVARGEAVRVEDLIVDFAYTDAGGTGNAGATLRNGRVYVNGAQVGSTTTLNPSGAGTTFTTNFTVTPGTDAIVEVRADLYDNDGTALIENGDAFTVSLDSNVAQGLNSLNTINASGPITANQVVANAGNISVAATSSLGAATIVAPQANQKLASFDVTNTSSNEDVNIDTLTLAFTRVDTDADTNYFDQDDLNNVYLKVDGVTSQVKATVGATGNVFSMFFTIPKSGFKTVEVYGNITSGADTTDTLRADLTVAGRTATSNVAVNGSANGRVLTAGTGAISAVVDGSAFAASVVEDNRVVNKAGSFRFTTTNDTQTITEVTVTLTNATPVQSVSLVDGGTTVQTRPGAGTVTFTGLNIPVTSNTVKTLDIDLTLGAVGVGAGTSGANVKVTMTAALARSGSSGVEAAVTESNPVGNDIIVFAATPTITAGSLDNSILADGSGRDLMKFTIASNGGSIEWNEIVFNVTKATAAGITNVRLYDATSGAEISPAASNPVLTGLGAGVGTTGTIEFEVLTPQSINGSKTYVLRADISATAANTSISTAISRSGLTAQVSSDEATVDATAATFVWSDLSASGHSLSTSDWHNDYLVRNLPVSNTLTRN